MADLKTSAAFSAGGATWVVGDDLGDQWAFVLPPDEVYALPFEVEDTWISPTGATYFAAPGRHPVVRFEAGRFARVDVGRVDEGADVLRIAGAVRGTDDVLYIGADTALVANGRTITLPDRVRELAAVAADEIVVAVGGGGSAPRLLRIVGGVARELALPPQPSRALVSGVHVTPSGAVLVVTQTWDDPIGVWLVDRNDRWTAVAADEPIVGYIARARACTWQGRLHVASTTGVFVLDEAAHRLERVHACKAVSLWPVHDGLLCHGWDGAGAPAHWLLRDGRWDRFAIPEPGVVGGGHGKVVSFGKRRIPVVKLRLPAPVAKRAGGSATRAKPARFTLPRYLAKLVTRDNVKRRAKRREVAGAIAAAAGGRIAPDLVRYLDVVGTHQLECAIGLWRPDDEFFPDVDDVASTYRHFPGIFGALTGTLPIGTDGGGDVFAVDLAARSEVHVLAHDSSELRPLASSFDAFVALNDVVEQWEAYCEATGVDDDDLFDRKLDRTPALEQLEVLARGLDRRVHLAGKPESDYDATINALARKKLRSASRSPATRLFERARWIYLLLAFEIVPSNKELRAIERRWARARQHRDSLARHPATQIYWLWHLFLVDARDLLDAQIEESANHRSHFVRATATWLKRLAGGGRVSAEVARVRALRDRLLTVRDEGSPAP